VLEPADRDDDDVGRAEPARELRHEEVARERADRLHRAEDRPPERVVAPELLRELVGDHRSGLSS